MFAVENVVYSASPVLKFGDPLAGTVQLRAQIERIDVLIGSVDPLLDQLVDVVFFARKEIDRALGVANPYSRQLVGSMYSVNSKKDREGRVTIARKIGELLLEAERKYAYQEPWSMPIAGLNPRGLESAIAFL